MPRISVEVEGLDAEIANVTEEINEIAQFIATDAGDLIISLSPVRTGFFEHNWRVGIGSENIGVSGVPPSGSTRVLGSPDFSRTTTWDVTQGALTFTNSVDYAEFLDGGSSDQAPQGVTEPVATIIDARFARFG